MVRVRPSDESSDHCIDVISDKSLLYDDGGKSRPRQYSYDHVFKETDSQVRNYVQCISWWTKGSTDCLTKGSLLKYIFIEDSPVLNIQTFYITKLKESSAKCSSSLL